MVNDGHKENRTSRGNEGGWPAKSLKHVTACSGARPAEQFSFGIHLCRNIGRRERER